MHYYTLYLLFSGAQFTINEKLNNSTTLVLILPLAWNICRKSTVIHAYVDFNVDHLGSVQRKRIKSSLFAREVGRILRWGMAPSNTPSL